MEAGELITLGAIAVVGVVIWLTNRGRIEGDPINDAIGIVQGIEHLWEHGRIDKGDRLDEAIRTLTLRYKYLDHDAAKVFIEGALRMVKQDEASE